MADSFFGFDTSLSNLNDDEGGGEPSEGEYDALNDETFGQESDEFDWEVEHEQLASQLESSRRHNTDIDDLANIQLEASLSQLVLDELDAPQPRSIGSSVWRHEPAPTTLKNVCTVEEIERQMRQKQPVSQHNFSTQNYFQPRFPVILQRPPGLQAPLPLPFSHQQNMGHINQPLNQILNQNNQMLAQNNQMMSQTNQMTQMNKQMGQNNMLQNHMGQNMNQFMQNNQMSQFGNNQLGNNMMNMTQNFPNQIIQNQGQLMQNQMGQINQLGQSQMSSNNPMGQNVNQMGMGQKSNQMTQNINQSIGQNVNQLGQNINQIGQNINQMGQNVNQMSQNVNQMGQNLNQMMPNGNQFGNMNQFPQMMSQPRMIAPPPGMNMPRQNFSPNMGQFSSNFRGPLSKPNDQQLNQQNVISSHPVVQPQLKSQPINQSIKTTTTNNQSPQLNQSPQRANRTKEPPQKLQKSRVYQNSNTVTSQNLVQMIQNTHPMLQFNNNVFNHAYCLPLNRNSMYNGQFHPMFNQRHNTSFSNNRQAINGDDASIGSDDECAGLMSSREKQWLVNIQMLQLNTGTPYIHDFYYTVFLERQKEKANVKEAHKANQQNHPFYSGGVMQESHLPRSRHNSQRHNSTGEDGVAPRTYVPLQFENSLGKLQCGSVTAPRKIIDVELVGSEGTPQRPSRAPSVASSTNPAEIPREMKKTKQLLLDIEALYLILLRLEELNDPLAISNALILKEREEKQRQLELAQKEAENAEEDESNLFLKNIESVQRRPKQESPKSETNDKRQLVNLTVSPKPVPVKNLLDENKDDLTNKMFVGLLHSDRLQQMLTVRKGRLLVARFLCRVSGSHGRLRGVWARVLRHVPHAARRDDGSLQALAPHYAKYIQNTTGWSAILESCSLLSEAFDPARTPYALTTSLTLSCVVALIEKSSMLINTPDATANERQWSKFLKTLGRALKNTNLTVARPVKPMQESKLIYHLKQLDSRSTIEILQRGKTTLDFVNITKTEVSEQLIKHLC